MTREEAKRRLLNIERSIPNTFCTKEDVRNFEALEMAIKALEQEPCGDLISRKKVLNQIFYSTDNSGDVVLGSTLRHRIENLPPVKQEPKTGHWVMPVQDDGMSDPIYYQVRCSECGFDLDPQTWHVELHQYGADKYCPNCGAKMESEEE